MGCIPCRAKKLAKEAAKNRTLKGAAAGCEDCEKGMAELEEKHPTAARLVRPVHDYLTGKDNDAA